jgi:predicted nucleotidyltransferase
MKKYRDLATLFQQHLPELQKRFGVKSMGIFGSYVRGEQRPDSDLDILVNYQEVPSLIEFIRLEDYLSQLTGIEVDLVMADGLKPRIGERILQEVVYV